MWIGLPMFATIVPITLEKIAVVEVALAPIMPCTPYVTPQDTIVTQELAAFSAFASHAMLGTPHSLLATIGAIVFLGLFAITDVTYIHRVFPSLIGRW